MSQLEDLKESLLFIIYQLISEQHQQFVKEYCVDIEFCWFRGESW